MDLKRYFRGPFVAVLVMLLVFFVVYEYASSGTSYTQTDTSKVVSLIDHGDVKSALLIDKEQTIQITTNNGQKYEASWVGNQGQQLAHPAAAEESITGLERRGPEEQLGLEPSVRLAAVPRGDPDLLLHAEPDAGRRIPGDELREIQGQADHQGHAQDHLRRRGRRGRGDRGTPGDQGVPAEPGQVPGHRGQDPEGRAVVRAARHRQDAAGPGRGRRGGRAVLLHLRL